MRWKMMGAATVLLAACGSTGQANVDPDLVGTWFATTGDPAGVTADFHDDGTFTWSNGNVHGTYEADRPTLTFSYAADSDWCPGGTLTWEYQLSGDNLTSDVVRSKCPGFPPLGAGPPSPDWVFERR
jgi:hypothetical protein